MPKNMNLGIFLPIGSSFTDQKKSGQDKRFVDYYLKKYVKSFNKVYIFSYERETYELPKNCILVNNKFNLHRFLYFFLMPFLNWKIIKGINIFRVTQLTGAVPAIITKIFFKKPFLFTYGYNYVSFARLKGEKIKQALLKILEKLAIDFSSEVIVTTEKIKQRLKKKYPKADLVYIPNGVDINRFQLKKLRMSQLKNGTMNILFVGRLEKQKNLDSLIKAIALLKDNKYKINLLFIGQGKLKPQLIKLREKLKINLKFVKMVPHDKLVKYYHWADIFCLPSFVEGQPKVLLEAMSCGLPCLVGRYFGSEEFKDREEVLLTGFKTREISNNLEELIKNHNLRKILSFNSRKRIEKDFNIKKLIIKETEVLKRLT